MSFPHFYCQKVSLHSPWFFWKSNYSSAWKSPFQDHFFVFFLISLFISMYDVSMYNVVFYINLTTLWTFVQLNACFNAYVKFILLITYLLLSCNLATSFWTFLVFILSGESVNHYQVCAILLDIEYEPPENIPLYFFHSERSLTLLNPFTGIFYYIT